MSDLDAADRRLLRALQKDAATSQADLAGIAGVSASQVSRRLARLKDEGALRGVVGVVEPAQVGLSCAAFVRVRLRDHAADNVQIFKKTVTRVPEVTLCVMLTGEADYLMKVVARDLPHFQEIIQSKLLRCPAVGHIESSIVLEYIKDTTELPISD